MHVADLGLLRGSDASKKLIISVTVIGRGKALFPNVPPVSNQGAFRRFNDQMITECETILTRTKKASYDVHDKQSVHWTLSTSRQ